MSEGRSRGSLHFVFLLKCDMMSCIFGCDKYEVSYHVDPVQTGPTVTWTAFSQCFQTQRITFLYSCILPCIVDKTKLTAAHVNRQNERCAVKTKSCIWSGWWLVNLNLLPKNNTAQISCSRSTLTSDWLLFF